MFSYSNYDARRSAMEAHALAQRQQERRRAEEIALYRHLQRRQAEQEEAELYQQLLAERQLEQQLQLRQEERLRDREVHDARAWLAQHDPAYRLRHQDRISAQRHAQLEALRQHEADALRQRQVDALRQRQVAAQESQRQAQDDSFSQLFSLFHDVPTAPAVKIPVSTPSPPPAIATPKGEVDTTLESNYEAHLLRREKLASLKALTDSFKTHQSVFVLPTSLVFQSPSTASTASLDDSESNHKLAFSKINGPFLAYEDFLVGLLSQADAVESGGDSKVKESRRALVLLVEAELKKLDLAKEQSWHEQNIATDIETDATESLALPVSEDSHAIADTVDVSPDSVAQESLDAIVTEPSPIDTTTTSNDIDILLAEPTPAPESDSTKSQPVENEAVDVDAVLRLAKELESKVEGLEKAERLAEEARSEREFVVVA